MAYQGQQAQLATLVRPVQKSVKGLLPSYYYVVNFALTMKITPGQFEKKNPTKTQPTN